MSTNARFHTCQNVLCTKLKITDDGGLMSKCAGCIYATYCSRDCQRSDWTRHRKFCSKSKVPKEKLILILDSKYGLEGLEYEKIGTSLRKWVQRHRRWQNTILIQELQIEDPNGKWRTHGVFVDLDEHNVGQGQYVFTLKEIFVMTMASLKDFCFETGMGDGWENMPRYNQDLVREGSLGLIFTRCKRMTVIGPLFNNPVVAAAAQVKPLEDWTEELASLMVPYPPNYAEIMPILRKWASQQRPFLVFASINCLDLRSCRDRSTTHMFELEFIAEEIEEGYRFTALKGIERTWSEYEVRCRQKGPEYYQVWYHRLKESSQKTVQRGLVKGTSCIVLLICGTETAVHRLFLEDTEIDNAEMRGDWQVYKYNLLQKKCTKVMLAHISVAEGNLFF